MVWRSRVREAPRQAAVARGVPYAARGLALVGGFVLAIALLLLRRALVDEGADARLAGDALKIDPRVGVDLGGRDVRAGELEAAATAGLGGVEPRLVPEVGAEAGGVLVEHCCLQGDVCSGGGDGNWDKNKCADCWGVVIATHSQDPINADMQE